MRKRSCGLRLCLGLLVLALVVQAAADEAKPETGFLKRVFKGPDGKEAKYMLFVPPDFKPDQPYPVIVFLHGSGASGSDGEKQSRVGLGQAIHRNEMGFSPFLVVLPQSQLKSWKAESEDGKRVMAILDEVSMTYKVDAKRIYLTGQSMGGSGTWSLAAAYPDRWAAIVPICGVANPATADRIKKIPCWCFHGDADPLVSVEQSRKMIEALKKAGAMPRYEEYAGVGHNSWERAYATKELYEWLLKQQK